MKAISKFIAFSNYKLRPIVDVIRNKPLDYALGWLSTYRNRRVSPIEKVIKSAFANAENLSGKKEDLSLFYIKEICVDQGPYRKYVKPGAQGRTNLFKRRHCHIRVLLEKKEK